MVFFPRSVKGEAAKLQFNALLMTDTAGRVRAVDGLRVVDASKVPIVPCANSNFPTAMTAEKIAGGIIAGY